MKAVIDLGSQSLRLLTFDSKRDILKGEIRSEICPLARDLSQGYLKDDRKKEALNILEDFIKDLPRKNVYLYATSALREAKDGQAFIEEIKRRLFIQAEIISGEEEGQLSYEGVKLLAGDREFSLLDLGGGSTEIVTPTIKKSYPMGVVRYQEGLKLENIYRNLPEIRGKLYGIGGSLSVFTSLFLGSNSYKRELIHAKPLGKNNIKELTDHMEAMSLPQRRSYLGSFEKRAETVVPAGRILEYLLTSLERDRVIYCDFSAIEGYGISRELL